MVQYSFTSTETKRLVRTDSPGRPPRLSHSSSAMRHRCRTASTFLFDRTACSLVRDPCSEYHQQQQNAVTLTEWKESKSGCVYKRNKTESFNLLDKMDMLTWKSRRRTRHLFQISFYFFLGRACGGGRGGGRRGQGVCWG